MIPARLNPFSCDRVEALGYRLAPEEWSNVFGLWERHGYRGAVIGPEGGGKTTFLEALVPRLRARGFSPRLIFLNRENSKWELVSLGLAGGVAQSDCLLLDGADELSWLNWWRFRLLSRAAGGNRVGSPGLPPGTSHRTVLVLVTYGSSE